MKRTSCRPAGATGEVHLALFVSILPATAVVIGVVVLRQIPTLIELAGVAFVILGVLVHREVAAATADESALTSEGIG